MSQSTTSGYLENLYPLHAKVKEQISNFQTAEVSLPQDFKNAWREKAHNKFTEITWYEHTVSVKNLEGSLTICPNQLFLLAKIIAPLGTALQKYKVVLKRLIPRSTQQEAIVKYSRSREADRNILAAALGTDVLTSTWKVLSDKVLAQEDITADISLLHTQHNSTPAANADNTPQLTPGDLKLFVEFLTHCDKLGAGKAFFRDDSKQSVFLTTANVVHADTGFLCKIVEIFNEHSELAELLPATDNTSATAARGTNTIIYGAPGTGKSYLADKSENITRTVFHPDTTMYDFVGAYRPSKEGDTLTYEFVPGPFVCVLVNALRTPNQHFTLLIEELNRANASAVFGEVFQLLDRDENRCSRYPVAPDKALAAYLNAEFPGQNIGLKIPANMSIVATMNSADQSVFPMDSAFKRRWTFRFMPISFSEAPHKDAPVEYAGNSIKWHIFATGINARLAEMGINEDRHIGPYFLTKEELGSLEAITSKLFLYLWDDVVRHKRKQFFKGFNTFSEMLTAYKNNEQIFTFDFAPDAIVSPEVE